MDTPKMRRRAVLGGVVGAASSIAGCFGDSDDTESDAMPNFGYGGDPVVMGDGAHAESAGDEEDDDEDGETVSEPDPPTIGFGAGPPELGVGQQGYGEHGYGGVYLD